MIIILIELAFLIAVVTCCITQSKGKFKINCLLFNDKSFFLFFLFVVLQGISAQILAALLILLSLLSLMTLIYFLRKFLFELHLAEYNSFSFISRRCDQR